MSRRRKAKKRIILPDPIYNSTLISKIINNILSEGKKTRAEFIFYEALKKVHKTGHKDVLNILIKAIQNATPLIEVKSRRVGGTTYQVPTEVNPERGSSVALKLIVKYARKRPGKGMINKLANEILDAYNNTGEAVKKKEEMHKKADANRAYSNLRIKKKK